MVLGSVCGQGDQISSFKREDLETVGMDNFIRELCHNKEREAGQYLESQEKGGSGGWVKGGHPK